MFSITVEEFHQYRVRKELSQKASDGPNVVVRPICHYNRIGKKNWKKGQTRGLTGVQADQPSFQSIWGNENWTLRLDKEADELRIEEGSPIIARPTWHAVSLAN